MDFLSGSTPFFLRVILASSPSTPVISANLVNLYQIMSPGSATHHPPNPRPFPVSWATLTEKNVKHLQLLNTAIFPINYPPQFYSTIIHAPPGFVKLAYHNNRLVAAVCCRKEKFQSTKVTPDGKEQPPLPPDPIHPKSKSSLYIMTLGVLAPYREHGIGTQLLNHVLDLVHSSPHCADVVDVYLHVQDGNHDALRFYQRFGFDVSERLPAYYPRIQPADCFIVRKIITRP